VVGRDFGTVGTTAALKAMQAIYAAVVRSPKPAIRESGSRSGPSDTKTHVAQGDSQVFALIVRFVR